MFCCGAVILFLNLGLFIYFLTTSYISKLETKFLSLDQDAGVCESVKLSTTEVLLLDKNGYWETSASFQIQEALFSVSFSAYEADDKSWKKDMDQVYEAINAEMTVLRTTSILSDKILQLISWRKTIQANQAGTLMIWFNAAPQYIFNTPGAQLDTMIGLKSDNCVSNDAWSINAEGVMSLVFNDVSTFNCNTFEITDVGYDVDYPTEDFSMSVDLRAAATVAALNANAINSSDLLVVTDKWYFTDDTTVLDYKVYYDPKFPDMQAVYQDQTGKFFQRLGNTGWTVQFSGWFSHWKADNDNTWDTAGFTGPYKCPVACDSETVPLGKPCNTPDWVFSFNDAATSNEFKLNLYSNEMLTLNLENMDPGLIGCATSTAGSGGVLGQLEPSSAAAFEANLDSQPFKLVCLTVCSYLPTQPDFTTSFMFDSFRLICHRLRTTSHARWTIPQLSSILSVRVNFIATHSTLLWCMHSP